MDLDTLIAAADPALDVVCPPPHTAWALTVSSASGGSTGSRHGQAGQHIPRSMARTAVVAGAALALMSGMAVAVGAATGHIDLGGGQSAQPVHTSLGRGDPDLPYRYRIAELPAARDGNRPMYVESTRPLRTDAEGRVDGAALLAARHACSPNVMSVRGAELWVFDTGCDPTQP
jgi:hypothetical protein